MATIKKTEINKCWKGYARTIKWYKMNGKKTLRGSSKNENGITI
jgi:hypothetical protein